MQRLVLVILLSVVTGSLTANDSDRARFKVSDYLQKQMDGVAGNPQKGVDVLIYLKGNKDFSGLENLNLKADKSALVVNALRSTSLKSQEGVVEYLKAANISYRRFSVANVIHAKNLRPHDVLLLANRPDVKRVVGDPVVKSLRHMNEDGVEPTSPEEGNGVESGITYMKADQVWEKHNVRGEGIVIAGQDTGVDFNHPAIQKQYRGFVDGKEVNHDYNWYDAIQEGFEEAGGRNPCGYASDVPCDDNGHGTHTIGTIVGDDAGRNKIGVAPDAKWIACRNMDNGYGRPSSYLACFQFFLAPFPVKGNPITDGDASKAPHVINNSWGCPTSEGCEGDEFVEALENLKAAGILVVASAGNEGSGCSSISTAPAHHGNTTLSVGALSSRDGSIAFFSSRGPSAFDDSVGPDVTAPGVNVRSAIPGGKYASFSGTSMAGPHVVGHIALMWSANEALRGDIDQTSEITRKTAKPRPHSQTCGGVQGAAHPNNTFGYGEVDTLKAVEAALAL